MSSLPRLPARTMQASNGSVVAMGGAVPSPALQQWMVPDAVKITATPEYKSLRTYATFHCLPLGKYTVNMWVAKSQRGGAWCLSFQPPTIRLRVAGAAADWCGPARAAPTAAVPFDTSVTARCRYDSYGDGWGGGRLSLAVVPSLAFDGAPAATCSVFTGSVVGASSSATVDLSKAMSCSALLPALCHRMRAECMCA